MGDIERTKPSASICNPRRLRISAAPVFMRRLSMMPRRCGSCQENILGNGSETHEISVGYDAYRLRFGRVLECNGPGLYDA